MKFFEVEPHKDVCDGLYWQQLIFRNGHRVCSSVIAEQLLILTLYEEDGSVSPELQMKKNYIREVTI